MVIKAEFPGQSDSLSSVYCIIMVGWPMSEAVFHLVEAFYDINTGDMRRGRFVSHNVVNATRIQK